MGAAFVKTAETVGTERLKNSGVDVSIVVLEKSVAIDLGVFGDAIEIVFERLFVEGDAGEAEEIIFEIVEIPDDGLTIEATAGIADGIVEIAAGFDLEFWEDLDDFAIGVDNRRRDDSTASML